MEFNSNTKEVQARLALIRAQIATGVFSDALVAGLNAAMGIMKRRIFNLSQDADGESLAHYVSAGYKKKRVNKGRQIVRKDLEFDGTLRRAIEVVTVNNTKAEIRLTDDDSANIARWQEQQIYNIRTGVPPNEASGGRVPIFELNDDEKDILRTNIAELIGQKLSF